MAEDDVRYYAEITEQRSLFRKRPLGRWYVKLIRKENDLLEGRTVARGGNFHSYNEAHQWADKRAWYLRRRDKDRTLPDRIEVAKERDA